MPFGSIFGAIVFGVFGPLVGARVAAAGSLPLKMMGVCLALLGFTVAVGLLMKRAWARWLGAIAGIVVAGVALFTADGVLHLTVMLAAAAATALLIVPATGRPQLDPVQPVRTSWASRLFFGAAMLGLAGVLAAIPFAFVGTLMRQEIPHTDSRESAALPADPAVPPAGRPSPAPGQAPAGPVTWHHFADGLKRAKSDGKLMVVDFYAEWCGPCKTMEKRTFKDPRVLKRLRDVVPVRVDAEEVVPRGGPTGEDLAMRYRIDVYPTIVVLDGSGREVARNTGAMGPDQFLSWIDSVLERAGASLARS